MDQLDPDSRFHGRLDHFPQLAGFESVLCEDGELDALPFQRFRDVLGQLVGKFHWLGIVDPAGALAFALGGEFAGTPTARILIPVAGSDRLATPPRCLVSSLDGSVAGSVASRFVAWLSSFSHVRPLVASFQIMDRRSSRAWNFASATP
ncbi:MAG: hypothetical protein Kow0069_09560 [Promethearchaeota archaeon]